MRKYKAFALLATCLGAIIVVQVPNARADQLMADGSRQGQTQFDPTGMSVVVHRGSNKQLIEQTSNIDPVSTVQCVSAAGCTIIVSSEVVVSFSLSGFSICSLVDRKQLGPSCTGFPKPGNPNMSNTMQSALDVPQGQHTFQTEIYFHDSSSYYPVLQQWQIVYTVYDH